MDASSLEVLAKDVAKSFKANVKYGVDDIFDFDWDGFPRAAYFQYWVLGRVEYPDAEKTLLLTDQYYLYHIVQSRYGDDAYKLPYFAENDSNKAEFDEALNNVCFELEEEYPEKDNYGTIYNDTFHNWYNYFNSRWYSFCKAFIKEDDNEYILSYVSEYRCEVMSFFEKIGGTETFYFNDQGSTQYMVETYYNWQTILKEIETNFKDTTLYISDFMKYKKLLPRNEYPLAFYDDFADLKKQKTNQLVDL